MSAPLVFMDTETTGLSLDDDVWEFAGIRREPDGTETELHLFIEHDEDKCARLPESFREDHYDRYLSHRAVSHVTASAQINRLFRGDTKAHVVGAVPNFDTERLAKMLKTYGYHTPWHYHLIDVENLAVGYLNGIRGISLPDGLGYELSEYVTPPWKSDDLAAALGVTITEAERHTAMGDARWPMRIYDAVMGGAR